MSKLFLKDGREFDLTEEQSIQLAKLIFLIPEWKKIRFSNGAIFCLDDIDHDKGREYRKPQLKLLDFEQVEPVEKKKKEIVDLG